MKVSNALLAAALATTASLASANDGGVLLSFKVHRNGQQVAAPEIWTAFGKQASIQLGTALRLAASTVDRGDQADISLQLSVPGGSSQEVLASPRLIVAFAHDASLEFEAKDGARYRVFITPTRQPAPVPRPMMR
jgi:hypothetical protein